MFKTLVIGIDGHPHDTEPLALARRLGDPGARLIAVQITPIDAQPGSETALYFDAEAVRGTERSTRRFGMNHEGVEVVAETAPSVGEGLEAVARRVGADAIVVGSSRRGIVGRLFAGDQVRETLRHAPCAVAVTPVGFAGPASPLRHVVIGHDGSAAADAALAVATELRDRDDCQLEIIDVVERATPAIAGAHGTYLGATAPAELAAAHRNIDLLEESVGVAGQVRSGDAAAALAQAALSADLLTVGLQHRGFLDRLVLGSAAHTLLRAHTAPLLIVPVSPEPALAEAGLRVVGD